VETAHVYFPCIYRDTERTAFIRIIAGNKFWSLLSSPFEIRNMKEHMGEGGTLFHSRDGKINQGADFIILVSTGLAGLSLYDFDHS